MNKILVTGFEPFAGAALNPSQLIVERLAGEPGIETVILPVEYDAAVARLQEKLVELPSVAAIVCLGQAEGRTAISFERQAVNQDNARLADNGGNVRVETPIDLDGEDALATTLPIERMIAAVGAAGIAAEFSDGAGTFVCNHLFYRLQQITRTTGVPSGFVHVPLVTEQALEFEGKFTMPLNDMVLGIKSALAVIG